MPWWLRPAALADLATSRRVRVVGHSMEPALVAGDLLLVTCRRGRRGLARGAVVLVREPGTGQPDLKRVCGLPSEEVRVRGDSLWVNGRAFIEPYATPGPGTGNTGDATWILGAGDYVVLGDNRAHSRDSRAFGPVSRDVIIGRAWYRYGPAGRSGLL